jgi:hypothetical protein
MSERTCQIDEQTIYAPYPSVWTPDENRPIPPPRPALGHVDGFVEAAGGRASRIGRRGFLKRAAVTTAAITAADFLRYFLNNGIPRDSRAFAASARAAEQATEPRFLIYWFLEGGWMGYDMFNPVMTPNNLQHRLANISEERYRVLKFPGEGYGIYKHGNIRYGYVAEGGKELFPDMAVLSSMHTGSGHSTERLMSHMGSYRLRLQNDREEDERSVMQAFAEVHGQSYVLPNLSWHWWLSDGELNEVQYTGRKGYYHALGPVHAHTIYAGTPANLRQFLMRMRQSSSDAVNRQIESFLTDTHAHLRSDAGLEVVRSYNSAREIYQHLAEQGLKLDESMLAKLFTDTELRERFKIKPEDELITYRSVNGNKARSKFCPNANVQALMTYELMRAGLSCCFWIESRDIRKYDSHRNRSGLWERDGRTPRGQADQTQGMKEDLWDPLITLVDLLKKTPYKNTGKTLWDLTTIVLTSEFGRTIHGDVAAIQAMNIPAAEKQKQIDGQDICQHWKVTSAAFLGGKVKGNAQYGGIGEQTLLAIPLLPDGSMDPAFDPVTGQQIAGREPSDKSQIPNHGDVYATALHLADIDPKGRGRNDRPPMRYIKKS